MNPTAHQNSRQIVYATVVLAIVGLFALGCGAEQESTDASTDPQDPDSMMEVRDIENEGSPYIQVIITGAGSDAMHVARIDAVVLMKTDGTVHYPESGPESVLGGPDAFPEYPSVETCDLESGSFELAPGDRLEVQMSVPIEQGDTLTILEVGNCDAGEEEQVPAGEIDVEISIGEGGDFRLETEAVSPEISFLIPELPVKILF